MTRRVFWIIIAAVASLALLAWALFGPGRRMVAPRVTEIHALPTPTPAPEQRAMLLFAGPDGMLHPELRQVPLPSEVHERVRLIVAEVLTGPTGNLRPVVPWPAELNAVFIDGEGTAFIDLTPPPEPVNGSQIELLLAYGIVDSILLNCPTLRSVQILFGGHEVPSLTGHLDLSRPLTLNKDFIHS